MNYVPISFKTDYSLLRSLLKIKDIIDFAKSNGASYVGILDDNPYAIMDFYDKCLQVNLKPIIGMVVKIGDNRIYLYIKDFVGYQNLLKINDLVNENKLTFNDLIKFNDGLIAVLPYENYNLYNRFKTSFKVYLGYKSDSELEKAELISRDVLFINEILCINKCDEFFLNVLYKIGGINYEKGVDYVLPASEFDKETVFTFIKTLNLEFDFSKKYIPKYTNSLEESTKLLYGLALKGLEKRLNKNVSIVYKRRLKYELDVISKMGFVDYFLIVYDYVKYAKKDGLAVGRGSAAGSLVSYTLGITDVDPIKYDLLFERFLNPERVTMPDIDMDFEDEQRNDIINYVRNKYGKNFVSLIVAYGTLKARQVIRDVGKILEIDEEIISNLSKLINPKLSLKDNARNKDIIDFIKNKGLEQFYKICIKLEGLKKHTTVHAAGVIISSIPLLEIIPTFKTSDGLLTGYTAEYLEKLGLLKMDFLAVRNLTILRKQIDMVLEKNKDFDIKKISLDDPLTYRVLSMGKTEDVFQFNTVGMTNFLKKLKPECFDDLTAAIALFRPGPMDNIDEYIERRKGTKKVSFLHPDLEPILRSTYGIIIYQEQIMQILVLMGGYSFAEADIIRRAMSKKKKEVMENERIRFIARASEKGYEKDTAKEVYDLILKFADYGFNKSHSVVYALVGYQMAYMKAHYSDIVQVNTLNMNKGSSMKTKDVIEEAKRRGLRICRPSIDKSGTEYTIKDRDLILPLTSIMGISLLQSDVIIKNRPYEDFFDFIKKVTGKNINRQTIETLIKAGAMDCFGASKNTLLKNIDTAFTYIELVESLDESLVMKPELEVCSSQDEEYSELDLFGFYISGHPASKYSGKDIVKLSSIASYMNKFINVVVFVDKLKVINTKNGDKMAFVDISDDTRAGNAVIFPKSFELVSKLQEGNLYKLKGKVSKRNDEFQLVIEELLEEIEFK